MESYVLSPSSENYIIDLNNYLDISKKFTNRINDFINNKLLNFDEYNEEYKLVKKIIHDFYSFQKQLLNATYIAGQYNLQQMLNRYNINKRQSGSVYTNSPFDFCLQENKLKEESSKELVSKLSKLNDADYDIIQTEKLLINCDNKLDIIKACSHSNSLAIFLLAYENKFFPEKSSVRPKLPCIIGFIDTLEELCNFANTLIEDKNMDKISYEYLQFSVHNMINANNVLDDFIIDNPCIILS